MLLFIFYVGTRQIINLLLLVLAEIYPVCSIIYHIHDNDISKIANGVRVTNINLGEIYNNYIHDISDLGGNIIQNGILAEGSFLGIGRGVNSAIRSNLIQGVSPWAWYQNGIRLETTICNVAYNTVENIGRGLFISGNCTGTETAKNKMINNHDGFFLNWAQLCDQLSNGIATQNEWHGSMISSHVYCYYTRGDFLNMYLFGNPSSSSLTFPSPFLAMHGPGPPNSSAIKYFSSFTGNSYKTRDPKIDLYQRITKDKVVYTPIYSVSTKWLDKYGAYRNLMQDDSLMQIDNADLKSFVDSTSIKNIGKLYRIGKELGKNTIINASIYAEVNTIIPENLVEQNLKDVYAIVATYRNNNSLSKTDIKTLKTIAKQCAYEGGYGVYSARVLLSTVDNTVYTDKCEGKSKSALKLANTDEVELLKAGVYPNPANDKLNVAISIETGQSGQLSLLDLSGRLILTHTLNVGSLTEIATDRLSEGLYIYKITINNELVNTGKLSIVR